MRATDTGERQLFAAPHWFGHDSTWILSEQIPPASCEMKGLPPHACVVVRCTHVHRRARSSARRAQIADRWKGVLASPRQVACQDVIEKNLPRNKLRYVVPVAHPRTRFDSVIQLKLQWRPRRRLVFLDPRAARGPIWLVAVVPSQNGSSHPLVGGRKLRLARGTEY